MVAQLHPAFAPVWLDPDRVRLGVGRDALVFEAPDDFELDLLGTLRRGATAAGLAALCTRHRRPRADADALLARLGTRVQSVAIPVDEHAPAPVPATTPLGDWEHQTVRRPRTAIAVLSDGPATVPLATRIAGVLREEGCRIRHLPARHLDDAGGAHGDLAVLCSHALTPPELWLPWQRADIPHLPVTVLPDGAVVVEAPVVPGRTPCLWCRTSLLAERDRDEAVARLRHSSRPAVCAPPLLETMVAGWAALVALHVLGLGPGPAAGMRLAADGRVTVEPDPAFHPDCACHRLPAASSARSAAAAGSETGRAASAPPPPAS